MLEGDTGKHKLEDYSEWNSNDGCPYGCCGRCALPEETETEYGNDTWVDEARIFLDVLEGLVKAAEEWLNGNSSNDEGNYGCDASYIDELLV